MTLKCISKVKISFTRRRKEGAPVKIFLGGSIKLEFQSQAIKAIKTLIIAARTAEAEE